MRRTRWRTVTCISRADTLNAMLGYRCAHSQTPCDEVPRRVQVAEKSGSSARGDKDRQDTRPACAACGALRIARTRSAQARGPLLCLVRDLCGASPHCCWQQQQPWRGGASASRPRLLRDVHGGAESYRGVRLRCLLMVSSVLAFLPADDAVVAAGGGSASVLRPRAAAAAGSEHAAPNAQKVRTRVRTTSSVCR